jgi:D-alanyl-D-alanine carboxypeptidase/D-alanyl-D-alanine-endopeptidase (penicillin-binding protein 4)
MTSLAKQTASALGVTHSIRLCLDTSAWPLGPAQAPGWNAGYFSAGDIAHLSPLEVDEGAANVRHPARAPITRVADPTAAAGAAFALALRRQGVTVTSIRCRATAPSSALGVASVSSPPVSALVQRMLTLSDNDLAESLGRAVARHEGQPADFAGEASAVSDQLHALGVDVTGLTLYDASGLSHLDRVSPHTLVQVVQLAAGNGHPELRELLDGMPVAGLTGTLATRYRHGPSAAGAGVARAKTGTLAGVNTITGVVVDADGRLLAFALMTDRASGPTAAEAALDRVVARLAGCGCR